MVEIKFYHPLFRQTIPDEETFLSEDASEKDAEEALDVAFSWFSYDDGNTVGEFRLNFVLKSLNLGTKRGDPLFGRIIEGQDVLTKFSQEEQKKKGDIEVSIIYKQR